MYSVLLCISRWRSSGLTSAMAGLVAALASWNRRSSKGARGAVVKVVTGFFRVKSRWEIL
ncbi:hypothetical protein D3C86_1838610 [compost metagenome]